MPKQKLKPSVIALMAEEPNTEGTHNRIVRAAPNLCIQRRENNYSWLMRWESGGKTSWMGLGRYRDVTQAQAEALVAKYMEVVRAGGDPRRARDEDRIAAGQPVRSKAGAASTKGPMTFRDVTRAFLADRAGSWKSDATEGHFAKQMRDHVYPIISDDRIDKIDVHRVVEVLKPHWRDHRPTAVKLRSRIGQVLDWAEAKGWRTGGNPARSKAIISLLGNGKHRPKHFAAIHYSQLPAFWQKIALADERHPDVADALRLQLLTATRPSDATAAEWSEIDFESRVWTIPAERMKMGREHRVPLSDAAMEVLERRRAAAAPDAMLIFPGTKPDQPISRQSLLKLIKRLGYNATAHGTARSSCREWAAEVDNQGFEICEAILAHQEKSATVAAYQRSDLLGPRRPVMARWADFLTG
jgi:integrase